MGLLDEITQLAGSGSSGEHSNVAGAVMEMLQSGQGGGLSGLVEALHSKGLGDIVSSWVGTGQNLPVSAQQVQSVLGNEYVQQLATKVGLSPDNAGSALAGLLPLIVDKLTPNGQLPAAGGGLLDAAMGLLKGKLGLLLTSRV
jgi:uncharacterized protein YidB (DUF937 family)